MMNKIKSKIRYRSLLVIAFWLLVWQLISYVIPYKILFASPYQVVVAFSSLCITKGFWITIGSSFLKIASGFLLALFTGILLAVLSSRFKLFKELILPIMNLIKSIPVASFVILAILWIRSENLSILISFFMVLPVIYTNILQGILSTDHKLLEMAHVFRLSLWKRIRFIYIPALMPYLVTAASIGLGFCWKSGVAAEVIGQPLHSIGGELYEAKLNLMIPELFAWTAVIILVSTLFEKLVMILIRKIEKKLS